MTKIGTIWRETFRRYWRTMVIFAIINVVIWFVVLALVKFNAFGLHDLALKSIKANFVNDESSHKNQSPAAPCAIDFGATICVVLCAVAISLIPIPFWWVTAVMNPASIGYLLGLSPIPVTTFFAGIFPHSIIEMPMQWLEFSIAWNFPLDLAKHPDEARLVAWHRLASHYHNSNCGGVANGNFGWCH